MDTPKGIRILSIDAKDIWLSNHCQKEQEIPGFQIRRPDGSINTRRFTNTLDYSLDLIKLREVHRKVYRNHSFSFWEGRHEYTASVINVTFLYSNKLFNQRKDGVYVRSGWDIQDLSFTDQVCLCDGRLAAVRTGYPVEHPVPEELLEGCFSLEDGCYRPRRIPTLNSVADLREDLYENGFWCDGTFYIRFKRSSGSARVGKCLFIDKKLYRQMHQWECCGLSIRKGQSMDLAAWESYISLTASSIIGTLTIRPENILIIEDYVSIFRERAVETRLEGTWLKTEEADVEIRNTIFDGQSLIDRSLLGEYQEKGMVLLRNRFFKSCCFNANLQDWFQDQGITELSQLNGYTLARDIRDILLITTPSSIKYLKFGTAENWLRHLEPQFGVVKYEKPTHYFDGRLVSTHYQLLNTLQMSEEEMEDFLAPTFRYLHLLKRDAALVRYHIRYPEHRRLPDSPLLTKNDIVFRLLGINRQVEQTRYYHDFKTDLTKAFVRDLKKGHVLVSGNYSTLLGNPIEMLLHSIGRFDGTSQLGIGCVHSIRFPWNQRLLASRSPHVTISNIWLPYNTANETIDRYINLTPEILCINSIGESVLDRNSGSDFDSDSLLLTDNEILIRIAARNYDAFLVPVNHVRSEKKIRRFTNIQKADLDIRTSTNKIGEIINLSQELNSLLWDRMNRGASLEDVMELYYDICQLDIMSGIEIDKAKKEFVVDTAAEMKKIREKYKRTDESGRTVKPNFFGHIAKTKGYYDTKKKNYLRHRTSMDFLQKSVNSFQRSDNRSNIRREFLPLEEILDQSGYSSSAVDYRQIDRILSSLREAAASIRRIQSLEHLDSQSRYFSTQEIRQQCAESINRLKLNRSTILRLLRLCSQEGYQKEYRTILNIFFGTPHSPFFQLIRESREPLEYLEEDPEGELDLYGIRFRRLFLS